MQKQAQKPAKNQLENLYLITGEMTDDNQLIHQVKVLLKAGVRLVQYRQKNLDKNKAYKQAFSLKEICAKYGAKLIINDDIKLALDTSADGVHLGYSDDSIEKANELLNQSRAKNRNQAKKIIGVSCYNQMNRVKEMLNNPLVDLISIGAFFSSSTKTDAKKAEFELINSVLTMKEELKSEQKIYAIGGITDRNIDDLFSSQNKNIKLDGVCVCAHLFNQNDDELKKRTQQLLKKLEANQ